MTKKIFIFGIIIISVLIFLSFKLFFSGSINNEPIVNSTTETPVKIKFFTRKLFNRTEYVLGIKNTDFKNLKNEELENEIQNLTLEQINLISNTLKNLKYNSISDLLKITDSEVVKFQTKQVLFERYNEDAKYFENYKLDFNNIGFVSTLLDESIIALGDFKEDSGESKMFAIILSKNNDKYYINSIFPGETSILVAYPPSMNKVPKVIGNPIKGFTEVNLDKLDTNILAPDNWFYRYEENNGTQSYFISQQEIKKDLDTFETGFTMNVNSQNLISEGDALKYMEIYIDKIKENGKIENTSSGEMDNYIYKQVIGTFGDESYKYKMALRIIVNKKTNTFYILIFESTIKKWELDWVTKGKVIFNYFSFM